MSPSLFQPVLEVWRGPIVESVHQGAIAVVSEDGLLRYRLGDPDLVMYLRSSAKPFQVLPFVELGGVETFGLTEQELAILCASHDGTDEHVAVLQSIQRKIGILESDLQCGIHLPYSKPTQKALVMRNEAPTPNRHNCSGKHTGMLGLAKILGAPKETYLELSSPVQQRILQTFSDMVDVAIKNIVLGIDGCSAPVFAVPLKNAALGFARLADPRHLPGSRQLACQKITQAMMHFPVMVSGPGDLDATLMESAGGTMFCKSGAEGYLGMGVLPGMIQKDSPALGITIKIAEGDISGKFRMNANTEEGRARPITALETLRQIGFNNKAFFHAMSSFDARPQYNWRRLDVGRYQPVFTLQRS
jgi:L-asparaginase II